MPAALQAPEWISATVPKSGNRPEENEDATAAAPDALRFAVSDGATEGWESGPWATRLVATDADDARLLTPSARGPELVAAGRVRPGAVVRGGEAGAGVVRHTPRSGGAPLEAHRGVGVAVAGDRGQLLPAPPR